LSQNRTRVRSRTWNRDNGKVLTLRSAIVACARCRNNVTSGVSDLADQIGAVWASETRLRAFVAAPTPVARAMREALSRLAPGSTMAARILLGNGQEVGTIIHAGTLVFDLEDFGIETWPQAQAMSRALRVVSTNVRNGTASCCRMNCESRTLKQDRRFIQLPHRTTRRRLQKDEHEPK